jgi:hypothetical protein
MLLRVTIGRRRCPSRWIARWALAVVVCLVLAGDAAAPSAQPAHGHAAVSGAHR